MDTHCHTKASDKPVMSAAGIIGCPECYSEPEAVYDQAMARGMDLVTITDHDTIAGALTLHERGFERFSIGQEVSVRFPEDKCLLHVLTWGLTPELAEQIDTLKLRADVYEFADWLEENKVHHSLAHPLYIQNGRLTRWHVERCALLFKGFECINGAHSDHLNTAILRFVRSLSEPRLAQLAESHDLRARHDTPWLKAITGGSDDHALLNLGRAWTEMDTPPASGRSGTITDPEAFLARLMLGGQTRSGGIGGHAALLAHQVSTVGANYFGRNLVKRRSPVGKYISAKLLRFFGVTVDAPSKKRVAAYKVAQRVWLGKKKVSLPIVRSLRNDMREVLEKYPDLKERLDPETWVDGAAVSEHEQMADFVQDMVAALSASMGPGAKRAFKKRDAGKIAEYLVSYAMLQLAQLPYMMSLFYQNKERQFLDTFEHETNPPGSGISVLERSMKISLFTDTLADINGVSRFIQNVAERAGQTDRDLEVITSTPLDCPDYENITNFKPVFSMKMPKYDDLDLSLPPIMQILRHVEKHQPDVIHISTPGPVGCIGFLAAKMLKVPVLGVYHTDFPAYIDRLFDDHTLTKCTEKFMQGFYKPFATIFTRSDDYIRSLTALGMPADKIIHLMPGFDAQVFNPRFKDDAVWERLGLRADTVKAMYCGRVSVEKNLPAITKIWKRVRKQAAERGVEAELIVVGDGPYREQMTKELKGEGVHFLGFKHGDELSAIYASSDFFVFPSTTDTLGQVVMESQGSGIPVVVTNVGGPKEVVEDGRSGFVLDPDDNDAWVNTLTTLITDHDRRKAMGLAAHHYIQQFSLDNSFEHFWEVHTQAWHEHLSRLGISPDTQGQAAPPSPPPTAPHTTQPTA
ncbi:MAG: glycosyltransferase involved in cell wall biosynthesis [Phycisphaerales bacterium]|jgi:glycosyltransferase involved in cell wall biosynthesis/predicted metal-dependent phosphoesterase TrpH